MATTGKHYLNNPGAVINSVDLSDHVQAVATTFTRAEVDTTASGDGAETAIPGLQKNSFEIDFYQDFAASEVDATLSPLFTGGSVVPFALTEGGTAASSTNPKYSGSAFITSYPPFSGKIGDQSLAKVMFRVTGAVTRGTA